MKGINPKLKLYCPVWYNRIRRTKDENKSKFLQWDKMTDSGTNIRNGSYCVVGELHGWDYNYITKYTNYCGFCEGFAVDLYNAAWNINSADCFRNQVNMLVDHIEKDHPEIVERCSKAQ